MILGGVTLHREADGAIVDCCDAVHETAAAAAQSGSSHLDAVNHRGGWLVRSEQSFGSLLTRNMGPQSLQLPYL